MGDQSLAERMKNVNDIFDRMIRSVKEQYGDETTSLDAVREIKRLEEERKKYLAICQTPGVTLTIMSLKEFFESPHKP